MSCSPPEHGGRLRAAARRYGIPLADWLDLSTGINPCGWPVPPIPPALWQRLPEADDGLIDAARTYYGCTDLLPLAGSQAAIQRLPRLRPPGRVGVLSPGYAEHAHAWRGGGHQVTPLAASEMAAVVDDLDVLVVINPGNPGGERFDPATLLDWYARLARKGGWLVVDEAFVDARPQDSLGRHCPRPGLVVLRSLGKFFGLAGARVGFMLAEADLLRRLDALLGPWTLAGPARWVAQQALEDRRWQAEQRSALPAAAERLDRMLRAAGLPPDGGCALFRQRCCADAAAIHHSLAAQGILTRLFDAPTRLRFGLPGVDAEWRRLEAALRRIRRA